MYNSSEKQMNMLRVHIPSRYTKKQKRRTSKDCTSSHVIFVQGFTSSSQFWYTSKCTGQKGKNEKNKHKLLSLKTQAY